ncbi:GNAT family N-acetyltransferase, partial [Vibrio zhanjiangensis]|uniref:GNAT family N-acetyltransferase n=1 Tax=Vibrio zhanjiangensis TaxID=1046128 RepID=UPI0032AEF893
NVRIRQSRMVFIPSRSLSNDTFHETLLDSMSTNNIREYIKSGYRYHIATDNGRLVGVIGMREHSHLYHLFVCDEYQGQGISRKLWEIAKSDILSQITTSYFTVNSALHAEHVYKKFGFERIAGIRTRGGMVDIPMRLDLPSQ